MVEPKNREGTVIFPLGSVTSCAAYSTQVKNVVDGHDAWYVYLRPATGTGSSCVLIVTKNNASASPECSN